MGATNVPNAASRPAAAKARRVTAGTRARLEELEQSKPDPRSTELLVVLCWLVRDHVSIDEAALNGARRRAIFVLAAGGDPHRELELDSVAAERLADGLPAVTAAAESLCADPDLAWRSFALSLLADELAEE